MAQQSVFAFDAKPEAVIGRMPEGMPQLAQVDAAEFGKWLSGTRRPQFDKLFAVVAFRQPLVIAIAKLAGDGVEVVTEIRVRKA